MFHELFFLWSIMVSGIVLAIMSIIFACFLFVVSSQLNVKIGKIITAVFGIILLILSLATTVNLFGLFEQIKNIT